MFFLFFLIFPQISNGNLMDKFGVKEPEFFEIKIDRDHPERLYKAFDEFKEKYHRQYKDAAEKNLRFNNFVKTFNQIEKFNQEAQKHGGHVGFGVNNFSDLSDAEFKSRLSKVKQPPFKLPGIDSLNSNSKNSNQTNRPKRRTDEFPDSFDLRDKKINGRYIVGEIKNQGACSCCWGFAVTALVETANAVYSEKFTSLSDQELCDCGTDGIPGCKGGNLDSGVQYVSQYGQSSDYEYPYDEHRAFNSRKCRLRDTKRVVEPREFQFAAINKRRSEYEIMKVLVEWNSPVAVFFMVGQQFKEYKYGILQHYEEDCYDEPEEEYHAGAIVGYGTDDGIDYWIVKNSWDSDWAEDGYFRVQRGIDYCGIESSPVTGRLEKQKRRSSRNRYYY